MAGPAAGTGHSTQSMAGRGRRLPSPLLRRPVESRPKCGHSILCTSLYQESESESHSVVSDSSRPHGLFSPWNSLGQNTGVGSLSLLGDLHKTGIKPRFPTLQADSLPAEPQGKPKNTGVGSISFL